MAATELAGRYNVIILEARSRLGGRIRTESLPGSQKLIEAGAEFIHGKLEQTLRLLKEAGIDYVPVEGVMYRREGRQWKEQDDMIEGWDELLRKMKGLKEDMTMHRFLQQYFGGDQYADLRRHAIAYTEGFDIADVNKASVRSLYKEWSEETQDENFRIPHGYGALIKYLQEACEAKGCRIVTNSTVKQIDWEENEVTVYTMAEQYAAQKVIITVPVSVLRRIAGETSINFTPPLDSHIRASHVIGMGTVIKVVLQFQQPFWKADTGFVLSDEIIPTWWTQLPDTNPLLTGWAGGTKAELLSDHSNEEILEKALLSLASIFEKSTEELKANLQASSIFNWQHEEHALGAYSYAMPGTAEARQLLNTPVANTIFFAGEGYYEGPSPGTVEAALVSGQQAAVKVLKS